MKTDVRHMSFSMLACINTVHEIHRFPDTFCRLFVKVFLQVKNILGFMDLRLPQRKKSQGIN
ncbi:hypothetical protein C0J52_01110 [Blattella germanica]|nr:hypothetical protein C0J52_01110 [Blattella germanica]